MKKYLILFTLFLAFSVCLFSCKKKEKEIDPRPGISGSLTINGTTKSLTVLSTLSGSYYIQQGTTTGLALYIGHYPKPTADAVIDLSVSMNTSVTIRDENNEDWTAVSGTLNISVIQGRITSSFNNVTFEMDDDPGQTMIASGKITTD
jgi:hypothetical protein